MCMLFSYASAWINGLYQISMLLDYTDSPFFPLFIFFSLYLDHFALGRATFYHTLSYISSCPLALALLVYTSWRNHLDTFMSSLSHFFSYSSAGWIFKKWTDCQSFFRILSEQSDNDSGERKASLGRLLLFSFCYFPVFCGSEEGCGAMEWKPWR